MAQPAWVLRQFDPNFFSIKIDGEETWIHMLHFSGRRQMVDQEVYRFLSETDLVITRKSVSGMSYFSLPPQKLAVFHPPVVGRGADLGNMQDCRDIARFLARFHRAVREFPCEPRPHASLGRLIGTWERRLNRLNEFVRLARYRMVPGPIDRIFLDYYPSLDDQIRYGLELLKKTAYVKQCAEGGQLCFFHFRSSLFWVGEQGIAPWHFAFCHWDLPAVDLQRFMSSVGNGHWGCQETLQLLEAYDAARPIDREEKSILHALAVFPERMLRLFASYYLNRTTRSSRRLMDRLDRTVAKEKERLALVKRLENM